MKGIVRESGGKMAVVVFWSISILIALAFSVTRRKIHLFEGIVIWCILVQIQNNFMGMFSINFHLMELSMDKWTFLAYDSIRSIIIPLAMIFFLEQCTSASSVERKAVWWVSAILCFTGLEYCAELLGVLTHSKKWRLWWSISFYTALVSITYGAFKLLRHIARREVKI